MEISLWQWEIYLEELGNVHEYSIAMLDCWRGIPPITAQGVCVFLCWVFRFEPDPSVGQALSGQIGFKERNYEETAMKVGEASVSWWYLANLQFVTVYFETSTSIVATLVYLNRTTTFETTAFQIQHRRDNNCHSIGKARCHQEEEAATCPTLGPTPRGGQLWKRHVLVGSRQVVGRSTLS